MAQITREQFFQAVERSSKDPESEQSKSFLQSIKNGDFNQFLSKGEVQKPEGFVSGVKNAFAERSKQMTEGVTGANPLRQTLRSAGTTAGLIGDIAVEGIKAITPKPIKETVGKAVESISQTEPVQKIAGAAKEFSAAYPELSKDLGAIGNIASLAITPSGAGAAVKAGGVVAKETGKVALKTAGAASKLAKETAKYATSQATGLGRDTINTIIKNPEKFSSSEVSKITREEFGSTVKSAIDKRIAGLKETGKGYDPIRATNQIIEVPKNTFEDVLSKYGIGVKNNDLVVTSNSRPIQSGDIKAIGDFLKLYNKPKLTPNEILNARQYADQLYNKLDASKSPISKVIGTELRKSVDEIAKREIKGLKELDAINSAESEILKQAKKKLYNADGTFKDNALSTLANIGGKGKEKTLATLEKIIPDIKNQSSLIKAIEDIQAAGGQKVGTYVRGGIAGAAALSANPIALIGALVSQPTVATQILRGIGYTKKAANRVTEALKVMATSKPIGIGNAGTTQVGSKVKELIENVKSNRGSVTPEGLTFGAVKESKKVLKSKEALKSGLQSWVDDYKAMREYGNIKGAEQARNNIMKEIEKNGLDENTVFGISKESMNQRKKFIDKLKKISPSQPDKWYEYQADVQLKNFNK